MLFRLGDPVELLPTVAGAVGEACMVLEAAVVALGVGVGGGLVVGVVVALPVIVTVMGELASQGDCADQALCFTVGGVAAVLSTVLEGVGSWLDTVTLVCFKRERPMVGGGGGEEAKIQKKKSEKKIQKILDYHFILPFYFTRMGLRSFQKVILY